MKGHGTSFLHFTWETRDQKLMNKNVYMSRTGLTQQAWVVQTLHVPKKGLAFDWFLRENSKPLKYPAQSECLYLPGALDRSRVYATVWFMVGSGPCCISLEGLKSEEQGWPWRHAMPTWPIPIKSLDTKVYVSIPHWQHFVPIDDTLCNSFLSIGLHYE